MNDLHRQINKVEQLAIASKWRRLISNPLHYAKAILFKNFVYPITKKGLLGKTTLFFGDEMSVLLPAGTDLYLTKGKSHDSEIRLAKFLINNLKEGSIFFDIGAHFGYYTLLASNLVGKNGRVLSFEASKANFEILCKNVSEKSNIEIFNWAVSDENGELIFNELPVLYSEYNSINIDQFKGEKWFEKIKPRLSKVKSVKLNDISKTHDVFPTLIKIDVEGAEFKVIQGALELLRDKKIIVAMEYLSGSRGNSEHAKAAISLINIGYHPNSIGSKGELNKLNNIEQHFQTNALESDNLVFVTDSYV